MNISFNIFMEGNKTRTQLSAVERNKVLIKPASYVLPKNEASKPFFFR